MLHEVSFHSFNDRDEVQGWVYVPACKPKGIVQVIHGFGEHSRRYFHMIVKFMDAGYIVAADDHVGHGKTAMYNDTWGDWGDAGFHTMMEDEHKLKEIVSKMYPDLPYFMFGHSMGSFITRDFAAKYGEELAGITICGTAGHFRGATEAESALLAAVAEGKGKESDPSFTADLMGWMCERCGNISIGNEWICSDPYVQRDHAEEVLVKKFEDAMEDDFNTADAVSAIFEIVRESNSTVKDFSADYAKKVLKVLEDLCSVLGIETTKEEEILDEEIEKLIEERQAARKNKDFARADEIRDQLLEQGIVLKDTREGVKWRRA